MNLSLLNHIATDGPARGNEERSNADAAARRHHAWQSAMEQAQLADWFKPAQEGGQALAPDQEQAREAPVKPVPGVQEPGRAAFGRAPEAVAPRSASAIAISQVLRRTDGSGSAPDRAARQDTSDAGSFEAPAAETLAAMATAATAHTAIVHNALCSAAPSNAAPSNGAALVQNRATEVQRDTGCTSAGAASQGAVALPQAVIVSGPYSLAAQGAPAAPGAFKPQPLPEIPLVMPAVNTAPHYAEAMTLPLQDRVAGNANEPPAHISRVTPAKFSNSNEPAPPVRVHIDWTDQGARVWLGVDPARMESVPGLARHLDQWLAASGVKLAALVCNGRTIYTRYSPRRPE